MSWKKKWIEWKSHGYKVLSTQLHSWWLKFPLAPAFRAERDSCRVGSTPPYGGLAALTQSIASEKLPMCWQLVGGPDGKKVKDDSILLSWNEC